MTKTIHAPQYITLIRRIRDKRQALGLSQDAVATKIGRGRTYVQKVEACERRLDFLETVELLKHPGCKS